MQKNQNTHTLILRYAIHLKDPYLFRDLPEKKKKNIKYKIQQINETRIDKLI